MRIALRPPPVPPYPKQVDGDLWRTAALIDALRLPQIAPSLGGVESLVEQPCVISYWDQARWAAVGVGVGVGHGR
jgi:cystathionine gamma-synthase